MDITGGFRVPVENDNGKGVADVCAIRGLCIGNTYFKHKTLHKYTRVASQSITFCCVKLS